MYRQQSSRNHRSKGGMKLKNVFQLCIMLVIGMWLLYQIKHSHDKKQELEEQDSNASYKLEQDTLPEMRRASRKDIPNTVFRDVEEVGKEEQVKKESKKGHDDEKSSHEAREKSFKGDDASSEVVHIAQVVPEHKEGSRESGKKDDGQEVEHEEGSHEAREKSFKGDDVSSAVAHKPAKDSELEEEAGHLDAEISGNDDREVEKTENGEMTGKSNGSIEHLDSNSTLVNGKTEAESSSEKKEPEVDQKTTGESGNLTKEQVEQKSLSSVDDQKGLQADKKDGILGNQTLLNTSSSNLESRENVSMNSTKGLEGKLDSTTNVVSEQNRAVGMNRSEELKSEVNIVSPQIQQVITEKKQNSETGISQEKPGENNSVSSRSSNETLKQVPRESSNANSSSNLGGIQSEVKSGQGEAAAQ